MRTSKMTQVLFLAILLLSAPSAGTGKASKARNAGQAAAPSAKPAPDRPPLADTSEESPESDSVARSDLQACDKLDVKPQYPANLDVNKLAGLLNGTWVRQLTWNGVPIETESAYYFEIKGRTGYVMMIDQVNLGRGALSQQAQTLEDGPGGRLAHPLITFVDCDYMIRDEYIKISSKAVFTGLPIKAGTSLDRAWQEVSTSGFLDRLPKRARISPEVAGRKPGGEMFMPAVVGALWKVALSPHPGGGFYGAHLTLDGKFRGTIDGAKGEQPAHENAYFFMEGNRFVAARAQKGAPLQGEASGWATSYAFGEKGNLVWERVVIDPSTGN